MPSSHRVSSSYLWILYDYLAQCGLDGEAVLGRAAPPPDPTGRAFVEVEELARLFSVAERAVGDPAMGLKVGAMIQPRHVGLVGYLLLNCRTLGQMMYRHSQFERLYWDANKGSIRPELKGCRVTWPRLDAPSPRSLDDCNLAALVSFARNTSERHDEGPLEVCFVSARPADTAPYERLFGCPVHFGASHTSIVMSYRAMLFPVRSPDPALYELLEAQARARIEQLPRKDDLLHELQQTVAGQLAYGDPTLPAIASRMGISPRTLQRRLEGANTSYQAVVDGTRQALAQSYLRDPALHLAELALLLGFADQAAFTRAFKRWHAISPSRWRKRELASPAA